VKVTFAFAARLQKQGRSHPWTDCIPLPEAQSETGIAMHRPRGPMHRNTKTLQTFVHDGIDLAVQEQDSWLNGLFLGREGGES
jgi:hypothetical protein